MSGSTYPFLDVQGVVKKFGGLVANNQVSMQIGKGEIRGLIGPNGSGKTTLVNVITGIYEPDQACGPIVSPLWGLCGPFR
jgi:branched-chain amino acid transport system ATP-binding protein